MFPLWITRRSVCNTLSIHLLALSMVSGIWEAEEQHRNVTRVPHPTAVSQLPLHPQVHSDQEMFSCGSLMARFSTSYLIKSDGCMDHGFSRWVSWGRGFAGDVD